MAPGPLGVGPSRGGLRQGPEGVCVLDGGASSLALLGPRSTKPLGGLGVGGVGKGSRAGGLPSPPIPLLLVWPVCPSPVVRSCWTQRRESRLLAGLSLERPRGESPSPAN